MSTVNLSSFAADRPDAHVELARSLAEAMRWTGAGSRAVPFPKGLVVQQWRASETKKGNPGKARLTTFLVEGGANMDLSRGNAAWPMLTHPETARVLSTLALRSYGLRFTRSDTGVWVVNETPTVPGAGLVFACDPHLGVVAALALMECVKADKAYQERLQIRLSMGLPG
jgi:hypothetical protein